MSAQMCLLTCFPTWPILPHVYTNIKHHGAIQSRTIYIPGLHVYARCACCIVFNFTPQSALRTAPNSQNNQNGTDLFFFLYSCTSALKFRTPM